MSLRINKQIDIFKSQKKIIETHILKKLLMYSQIKTSSQSPRAVTTHLKLHSLIK